MENRGRIVWAGAASLDVVRGDGGNNEFVVSIFKLKRSGSDQGVQTFWDSDNSYRTGVLFIV